MLELLEKIHKRHKDSYFKVTDYKGNVEYFNLATTAAKALDCTRMTIYNYAKSGKLWRGCKIEKIEKIET